MAFCVWMYTKKLIKRKKRNQALWPNSSPHPQDIMPTEAALIARGATAIGSQALIPHGVTTANLNYEELLTAPQHEMLPGKAISIFEDEAIQV